MLTIDNLPLRALRVVATVSEVGNFAAAGRRLGLPRAAVSRVVGQVENQLGTRLFRRSTRRVVMTEAGAAISEAARRAIEAIEPALAAVRDEGATLSGPVRFSVSHAFGRHFVVPAIEGFRSRHPGVLIDIVLEDRLDDLVDEAIDFTIRIGPLPESGLIARRVGAIGAILVAAPGLVTRLGGAPTIADLDRLPAVGFRVPGTGRLMAWPIMEEHLSRSITPTAVVSSGSIEAIADLARGGAGAALLPRYLVAEDIAQGRLLAILTEAVSLTADVHLCFLERRLMPKRVRAFMEHLAAHLAAKLADEG